jgi:hypothetical protein
MAARLRANIFVYTAVKYLDAPFARCVAAFALLALAICAAAPACRADSAATNAARELAAKVAAQLETQSAVHVEFRDLTNSLGAADMAEAQQAFQSQLTARGFRIVAAAQTSNASSDANSAVTNVRVSLSADIESRLWVAEFARDGKAGVAILSFAAGAPSEGASQGAVLIQRQLILSQAEPILDFAFTGQATDSNSALVVLSPGSISLMRFRDKSWRLQAKDLLPSIPGMPRDLQGRIMVNGGNFDAWLANVNCTGPVADVGSTRCTEAKNAAWDFAGGNGRALSAGAVRGRNWFQWPEAADGNSGRESFYGIAGFAANDQALWAAAGTDGRLRVYAESGDAIANVAGFGSQIASVQTACGTGWQVLTTRDGDFAKADSVQAQEWTGHGFRPLSAETEFDGPVLALRKGSEVNSVRAMVRNLKTGNYEAFSLSVYCNR